MTAYQLFPDSVRQQLPALYSQEHVKDPIVISKFFHPLLSWKWYAFEGSPVDASGLYDTDRPKIDYLFFGWVYSEYRLSANALVCDQRLAQAGVVVVARARPTQLGLVVREPLATGWPSRMMAGLLFVTRP